MHLVRKIVKILIYILCGVLLLLFVASFFIDSFTKRWLENEVAKADRGQYSLQLDEVSISLLRGNIVLKGISFETETESGELAPVIMVDVTEFSANGVSWLTFVLERRLLMDELKLDGLDLRLTGSPVDTTRSGQPFSIDQLDVYPQIREHIRILHLQDLALSNIDFTLINSLSKDTLQFSANRLDLQSKDILIDADELITKERAFYAAFIDFDGKELELRRTGNASWLAEMDRLHFFTEEDMLGVTVQALHYLHSPTDSKDTLILVELQDFELRDLNLHKLQEEEIAAVQTIRLAGLDIINDIDKPSQETEKNTDALEQSETKKLGELSGFSLGGFLPEFANSLELAELELKAISYRQGAELNISNAELSANDIVLDEKPAFADGRFLHAGKLQSRVDQFELSVAAAEHLVRWDKLQLEAEGGIAKMRIRQLGTNPAFNRNESAWLDGEIGLLQFDAIDTRRLDEGVLQLGRISTEQARLQVNMPQAGSSPQPGGNNISSPDLYPALEGILKVLRIESLNIMDGSFELTDVGGNLGNISVPTLNLKLNDILIDRESAFSDGRLLHSRDIELDIQNADYLFPDKVNSLRLGNVFLNSSIQSFRINDLSYSKLVPENELLVETSSQLSTITTRNIDLHGIDFQQLLMGKGLQASALGVHGTEINLTGLASGLEQETVPPPARIGADKEQGISLNPANLNAGQYLPGFMKTASIDSLAITGINVKEENGLHLENFRIDATSVRLDDKSAFADQQFLHAKTFKTSFDTLWVLTGQPAHYVMTKDFKFTVDRGKGTLALGQVLIRPQDMPMDKAWIEADIPALKIPDIDTRQLSSGILRLDEVVIRKAAIVAHMPATAPENKESSQDNSAPNLFPLIDESLRELWLGRLAIEEGEVRLAGLGGSYYGMSLHDIDLEISDLYIAEGTAFDNNRILHTKDFDLSLDKLIMLFPDKVYSLELDALALNAAAQTLDAGSLRYLYNGNYKTILEDSAKNDVYRLVSDGFTIEGINYQRLFKNEEFYAQTVRLNGLDLYIFKDLNMPEAERIKPMPRDMVFKLGFPVSIASLQVEDFAITYEEMAEGSESAGLVTLMEVSTSINNISNIHEVLLQQPEMQVKANGRLMGKGYFETQMDVPLLDEQKKLRIRGSIDTLDMSRLNRISRYNSRIAIQEGTLYKASWDFEADGELASGDFEVSYENLQVQLSSKDSPDTTGVLKDIGSFLANLIVVESNIAASKTKEPKKVTFEEKRNKQKSFFNFYVHALLTGLMEAIGVPFQ